MPNIQLKSLQIPILVIGTKADLVDDKERLKQLNRNGNIGKVKSNIQVTYKYLNGLLFVLVLAEQCGADDICLDCHEIRSLVTGSDNGIKLNRFFDKVIERKYYSRSDIYGNEKRKFANQYNVGSPPMFVSNYQKMTVDSPNDLI